MQKILNMNTIELKGNISIEQYDMAIRVLEALGLKVAKNKKDKPNKLTLEAMKEAEQMLEKKSKKRFKNVDELLTSLND